MDHVRLTADRTLHDPVLVFAFTGWNDAGEAASTAVRTMIAHWGATLIGEIDPEPFTDFATVRPNVYLHDGRRHIAWPVVQVWAASLPGADAILVIGPEPALQWRLFTQQLLDLTEHFDVSMCISLGALLADVPHSHPVHVIGTTTDDDLIDRFDLRRSTYEGPTGIVGVLQDALASAGIPAVSLWATVPGYAAQIPSPKACEALMRSAGSMIGAAIPAAAFAKAIADYEARITALVAEDDDLATYVSRLEALMDADDDEDAGGDDDTADVDSEESPTPSGASTTGGDDVVVDSEEFLAEVEQFLRDADPPSGDSPPDP